MQTQFIDTIHRAEKIKARIIMWLGDDREGLDNLSLARYEDLVAADDIEHELTHALEAARIEREAANLRLASIQLTLASNPKCSVPDLLIEKERATWELQKFTNAHRDARRLKLYLGYIVRVWKSRTSEEALDTQNLS